MVPSYGASTAHAVLNVFTRSKNPTSFSKSGNSIATDMSTSAHANKALAKPKDKRISSPFSSSKSSSASPQGPTPHDSEDADMVFVSSPKYIENIANKNTGEQLFTDTEIQDIFRPRSRALSNGKTETLGSYANGTVSPKRISRTSRESTGSSCSEGHAELSKSNSSTIPVSPLPKLLESLSPAERASMTRPQIVAQEILVTERTYVRDLQEVIEGYLIHLLHHGMTDLDIETIFGNLEDIYDFNKNILEELENIEEKRDPVLISQCFLKKAEGFNSLYVQYCTNYPESAAFLAEILKDKEIADFFLERQKALGHTLPLDSYLMKPVQRIMKYHLLFKDMAKHVDATTPGFDVVQTTAAAMADVAEYINEMKRLHENALRVEEILGSIEDLNGLDVFATGRLVLENLFRIHGSRGDKQLYLFEKLLLICKKLDEGNYQFRDGISCSNMMLVESIAKEPLCFQLIRFDNQKVTYTIQAKNLDTKKEWTKQLKRLIIENHSAMIPLTAREAILGPDKNIRASKYNTIPLQALDEKIHWRRQKQNSSGKENQPKDRGSILIGAKRESMVKEESSPKKSSLNAKAKDFLEKKDSKDKLKPWKLKRNKPRKTTSSTSFEIEATPRQVTSPNSDIVPPTTVVKSRSLESLRDALSGSQDNLVAATEEIAPAESKQPDEASEQIRRLSLLHELISFDANDQAEANTEQQTEDDKPSESFHETPKNIKALRRMHVSKSVYLDLPDDPLRPGDLKRSRPLSLPPDSHDDKKHADLDSYNPAKQHVFEVGDENQTRTCNDLRKYGLTRTRSFSRKSRGSTNSLAGSSSSVNAIMMESDDRKSSAKESETTDDFDQLEKRLSIISDDDKASSSIKNTLRQVSQAFSSHGSERALNSISSLSSGSNSNLSADLGAFLLQDISTASAKSKRRSLGSIISETINPLKSLDESKKRAYSTTVINEVSMDAGDEELLLSALSENQETTNTDALTSKIPDEVSLKSVKERIDEYPTKFQNSDVDATLEHRQSNSVSQASDSRFSHEEIQINDNKLRPSEFGNVSSLSSIISELSETSTVSVGGIESLETKAENENEPRGFAAENNSKSTERTTANADTLKDSSENATVETEFVTPKRPAAPSKLNYVGSYAASVRRYRKKNTEIKESKSVYDRIRAYTALVSEEKSLQREDSVDDMLETLDSANVPASKTYYEKRRKFASMASMSVDNEKVGSYLGRPEVWFDTDSDKKSQDKTIETVPKTKNEKTPKSPIDKNESKTMKTAFTMSRIRFKDLEDERRKESKDSEVIKDDNHKDVNHKDVVVKNVVKSTKKELKVNTLPRSKAEKIKGNVNSDVNKVNKNTDSEKRGWSPKAWKNKKSHTIDRGTSKSEPKVDNNDNDIQKQLTVDSSTQEQSECALNVKDIVKVYQKTIIVPGEKEVEEMKDSNMRRSKKKKERETAKSNLQRKLSLRNLDAEEKEECSKLSRSVSCESVQRGTVKQLINLFSIRK